MHEPFTREALRAATPVFTHPVAPRFQDADAAGVVFFARILEYFHDTYAAFLAARGLPLEQMLASRAIVAPLRHAEADFLRPVRFGDRLTGGLVRVRFDRSAFTLGHRLADAAGVVRAVGVTQHVVVDASTFRPTEMPESFRSIFADLERA